jgi:hypothetical protein
MGWVRTLRTGFGRTAVDSMSSFAKGLHIEDVHCNPYARLDRVFGMSESTLTTFNTGGILPQQQAGRRDLHNFSSTRCGVQCTNLTWGQTIFVACSSMVHPRSSWLSSLVLGDWCHLLCLAATTFGSSITGRPTTHHGNASCPGGVLSRSLPIDSLLMFCPVSAGRKVGHWQTQPQRYVYGQASSMGAIGWLHPGTSAL